MREWLLKQVMAFIAKRMEKEILDLRSPEKGSPYSADFQIDGALKADFGREVARMHWSNRRFASRYDIVSIKHENKRILVPILGLDGEANRNIARLGYDLRTRLGISSSDVSDGARINLTIEQVGWWGQLYWYLSTKDPAVKIPAWLAFWSVILGLGGFVLGLIGLLVGFIGFL